MKEKAWKIGLNVLYTSIIWRLWEIFPAISVNKDVTVISDCSPPPWADKPEETQKEKEYLPSSSHKLKPLLMVSLRKLRMWKYRILALDRWGTYQRNDFREPRLLHLPIHRKALNSITWDIWFSLINNHLFMF